MKHVPFISSIVAVIAIFIIAQFAFPEPSPLPVISSLPSAPPSIAPTKTPPPRKAPDPKEAIEGFEDFTAIAEYKLAIERGEQPLPLMLNLKTKQILLECEVTTTIGRVEYALVGRGGKAYESLLMAFVSLQNLGIVCGTLARIPEDIDSRSFTISDEGKIDDIWPMYTYEVFFTDDAGTTARMRIEDLVFNQVADKPMAKQNWAYIGSYFHTDEDTQQETWAAEISKNICAMCKDSSCLFITTSKEWQNDDLFVANSDVVPPMGTRVLVLMTLVHPAK